jgi:aryl-alcohol dehydrogenase-like predicted oxidoreductase
MDLTIDASAAGTFRLGGELAVHRLGFGGMRLCGPGVWDWPADRENALAVLSRAVEVGVNFIDTADAYGPEVNERQIAQALHPYPDGLVIATKGGLVRSGPGQWERDARPERLRLCCDESLQRLRLERIDLYQLHAPDTKVPLADQIGTLKEMQDVGKIRFIGVSNVTLEQLREAQRIADVVSVQNPYNVGNRHGNEALLAACENDAIAFIPYFPLDGGDLDTVKALEPIARAHDATTWQVALAWLLHRSPVMLPIPGTSSLAHLDENVAAASLELSKEEYATLDALA